MDKCPDISVFTVLFSAVLGMDPGLSWQASAPPLSYISSPFYFLQQGLTKLLRLVLNFWSSLLSLPSSWSCRCAPLCPPWWISLRRTLEHQWLSPVEGISYEEGALHPTKGPGMSFVITHVVLLRWVSLIQVAQSLSGITFHYLGMSCLDFRECEKEFSSCKLSDAHPSGICLSAFLSFIQFVLFLFFVFFSWIYKN